MSAAAALQFVVLKHQSDDGSHFDLMFETAPGSQLATWRSPVWPLPGTPIELQRLKDHRRLYLDYEGDISGGRGNVIQIARGECGFIIEREGAWTIRLATGGVRQILTLTQLHEKCWEGSAA